MAGYRPMSIEPPALDARRVLELGSFIAGIADDELDVLRAANVIA
jgi:hypothetical protein